MLARSSQEKIAGRKYALHTTEDVAEASELKAILQM